MIQKYDKSEVAYESPARGMDNCRDCKHFEVFKPNGCEIVRGHIKPGDWCNKFKRARGVPPPPRSKDGS